jgi:hypothetical protein
MFAAGVALGVAALAVAVALILSGGGSKVSYAQFEHCPLRDPATKLCLFTQTTGGELIAGDTTVPLSRTVTLQGGVHVVENEEKEIVKDEFIAAKNGETLSKTPQPVPGGLRAVVDPSLLPPAPRRVFDEFLARGTAQVTAMIELAAPPSSIGIDVQDLIEAQGTALALPVKVKLSSPFLGAGCYIGSNARPIRLPLTTGQTHPLRPNKPIEGKVGKAKLKDDYNLTVIRGSSLVDNAFAAPAATGCGKTGDAAIDSAINAKLGLPAGPGHNTAILDGTLQDANAPAVRASR